MTTNYPNPFEGLTFGDLIFLTTHERNFYIGRLSPSQCEKWRQDHPGVGKIVRMLFANCKLAPGIEAEPAKASSTTEGFLSD